MTISPTSDHSCTSVSLYLMGFAALWCLLALMAFEAVIAHSAGPARSPSAGRHALAHPDFHPDRHA